MALRQPSRLRLKWLLPRIPIASLYGYGVKVHDINAQFIGLVESNNDQIAFNLLGQNLNHDVLEYFVSRNIGLLPSVMASHPNFVLSNELWSLYVLYTCETLSLQGAKLIYHSIIDSGTNTGPPFLINTESIQQLGFIFRRNLCPDYLRGLLAYFKRFYSIYGHKSCYKSLLLSQVETYSEMGDVKQALYCFKFLCIMFRGHYNSKSRHEDLEIIYSMMNNSFNWRMNNLRFNEVTVPENEETFNDLDKLQRQYLSDINVKPYNPLKAKSVTTRLVPCFDGSLQINDLPHFQLLISRLVDSYMKSDTPSKRSNLLRLITSNHFMLSSFVVSGLSSNLYLSEAIAILKKIQPKYHGYRLPTLFKHDVFIHILQDCKRMLSVEDISDLVIEVMNFYMKVYSKRKFSSKVFETYLELILEYPRFRSSLVTSYLIPFMSKSNDKIYLQSTDYEKLNRLFNINSSQLKEVIKVRL